MKIGKVFNLAVERAKNKKQNEKNAKALADHYDGKTKSDFKISVANVKVPVAYDEMGICNRAEIRLKKAVKLQMWKTVQVALWRYEFPMWKEIEQRIEYSALGSVFDALMIAEIKKLYTSGVLVVK